MAASQLESEPLFGVLMLIFGAGWVLIGQMPSLVRAEVRV